jgi:hypothetical protein
MNESNFTSRRSFLKRGLICLSTACLVSGLPDFVQYSEAEVTKKALNPEDPVAKGLGYVVDSTKVDSAELAKKGQPDPLKQRCSTCILFKNGGQKVEGAEGEYGDCSIFPMSVVNANGWCKSWALNPALSS